MPDSSSKGNRDLLRYAGLGTQILVGLGLAVFLGIKLDEWLKLSFPIAVIVFPMLVLFSMLYKIVRDTNSKK